jgi:hypothetical protein
VSYGLRHIVKPDGPESFFTIWNHSEKPSLAEAIRNATDGKREFDKPQKSTLDDYIQFCAAQINALLIGFKMSLPHGMWNLDRKVSRALSTTSINGLIFCLRLLLEQSKTSTMDGYKAAFKNLTLDYTPKKFKYKSSHWRSLGEKIVKDCF